MNDDPYMVLARALHEQPDHSDYVVSLDRCPRREADIADAISLLGRLASEDWILVKKPVGVAPMGL